MAFGGGFSVGHAPEAFSGMKYLGVTGGQAQDPAAQGARHSEGAGQGGRGTGGRVAVA